MKWILIVMLWTKHDAATISMQEFATKAACEAAASFIQTNASPYGGDAKKALACLPKGY